MNFYALTLFLHIIGALGLFIGMGMEVIILKQLRDAKTNEQAFEGGGLMKKLRTVFLSSTILLLLSGIYLVETSWGWTAWVILGLTLMVVLSVFGSVSGKKVGMTIAALGKPDEFISEEARKKLSNPVILKSLIVRTALSLGIIFMMTLKPDWMGGIITIVVTLILGYLVGLPSAGKIKELESA
jgi:hypothetical protein